MRTSWWVTQRERRVASRDVTVRETSCSLKTAHAFRRASAVVNTTTSFTRRGMYLLWIVQSMWSYLLHCELAKVRFVNIVRIVSQGPYWPFCHSLLWNITSKQNRKWNEETGGDTCPAIVPRIANGDAPVSYWPIFFPVPSNSPRSLCDS